MITSYQENNKDRLLPSVEFVYNTALSEALEMSPLEICMGWQPEILLDSVGGKEALLQSVHDFKEKLRSSSADGHFYYHNYATTGAAESSHRYRAPSHAVDSRFQINKSLVKDSYSKS